jgi:protein-S-isoprenylcysteine O-methyltransferase Ste14
MLILFLIPASYAIKMQITQPLGLAVTLFYALTNWYILNKNKRSIQIQNFHNAWLVLPIIAYFFMAAAALFSNNNFSQQPINVGMAFFLVILGGWFNYQALSELNTFFSPAIKPTTQHELVITGIYSIIRHPKYLAGLLSMCGLALVMNNILAGIALSVLCFGYGYRIKAEEKILSDMYSIAWQTYKKKSRLLIPFIY